MISHNNQHATSVVNRLVNKIKITEFLKSKKDVKNPKLTVFNQNLQNLLCLARPRHLYCLDLYCFLTIFSFTPKNY